MTMPADKVRAALCAAAAAHEKTLRDRPVEAHVVSYGDSSIQYVLRFWARTEDYWTCYNDLLDGMQEVFSRCPGSPCAIRISMFIWDHKKRNIRIPHIIFCIKSELSVIL